MRCFAPSAKRGCERARLLRYHNTNATLAKVELWGGIMDRKTLTFEEAEGAHPLPSQLDRTQLSPQCRSVLWAIFLKHLPHNARYSDLDQPWGEILKDEFAFRQGRPIDNFNPNHTNQLNRIRDIIFKDNYLAVFGFIQWIIRNPHIPSAFVDDLETGLARGRSAYRLVDRDTIAPTVEPFVASATETALFDTRIAGLNGARSHLQRSVELVSARRFAESVRESIHAVEATAILLAPGSKSLGPALSTLERSGSVHEAMKKGFSALYGFTSDERGIRHSLLDQDAAKVDEADALFMLGACASFVSYLIAKGRSAGLLEE